MNSTPLMACAEVRRRELRSRLARHLHANLCACSTGASYSQLPGDVCCGGHSPDGFPGVGQADDEMDVEEPAPSPQPGRAPQPKPPSPVQPARGSDQPSEPAVKMEEEVDQEEEEVARLDESTWARLQKRRWCCHIGSRLCSLLLSTRLGKFSLPGHSAGALGHVRHHSRQSPRSYCSCQTGGAPDYVTRLCIGALAFASVRQADIFLREQCHGVLDSGRRPESSVSRRGLLHADAQ